MKSAADLFQKTVHKIERKRLDAIERWIIRCLKIGGLDPEELKRLGNDMNRVLNLRGQEIEHRYRGIDIDHDTEIHWLYLNDSQIGTTLKIRHQTEDRKITLTVTESLPEVREVTE